MGFVKRETILIIESNIEVVENIKLVLEPMNYQVLTAYDSGNGLLMACEAQPALILLDFNIAILDNMQMLVTLQLTNLTTPVIIMTESDSEQIGINVLRLGVRNYLKKPFTSQDANLVFDSVLHELRLENEHESSRRKLLTAEAVRVTMVTLSHYINNYLTVLNGGLKLLEETLNQDWPNPDLLQILGESRNSAANIETVIKVLLQANDKKLTPYTNTTPMLDIETELNKELFQLMQNRQ